MSRPIIFITSGADAIGIKADATISPIGARTELPKIKYNSVASNYEHGSCQPTATTITTVKLSQQPQQQEIQ
ncbi:hypothetical protein Glove_217g220 [Diversispora epigaea]|uniref:Uncharacterized protein n=1 Tax=Diversispora epigaea TaxID=1348612 RepID=A0A397IJI9_9GLOM|nr:hypothetical protein Glove_217g220 [Diversispora epigaea]